MQVSILDGAALANVLQPGTVVTFTDYAAIIFVAYSTSQFQIRYYLGCVGMHDGLKTVARNKRGKGTRLYVQSSIKNGWCIDETNISKTFLTTHQSNMLYA